MSDMPSQLQQALDEWLASLPWYRRWTIKAGLFGGGYTTAGGRIKPQAGSLGLASCALIVLLAIILGLAIATGIAACVTK